MESVDGSSYSNTAIRKLDSEVELPITWRAKIGDEVNAFPAGHRLLQIVMPSTGRHHWTAHWVVLLPSQYHAGNPTPLDEEASGMVPMTMLWRPLQQVVINLRGFRTFAPVGDMLNEILTNPAPAVPTTARAAAASPAAAPPSPSLSSPPLRGHQHDQPPIVSGEYVRIVNGQYRRYGVARVVCLNGEYQLTLHHPSLSRDIRIARSSVDRLPLEQRFGHEPVPGVVVGSEVVAAPPAAEVVAPIPSLMTLTLDHEVSELRAANVELRTRVEQQRLEHDTQSSEQALALVSANDLVNELRQSLTSAQLQLEQVTTEHDAAMAHALVALGGGDGADACAPCDDAESGGPDFDDPERYRRMEPLESENASLREAMRNMRPLEQENASLRADVTDLQ